MAAPWLTLASLVAAFAVGAAAASNYQVTLIACAALILAILVRYRLKPLQVRSLRPIESLRPDWIVILFPLSIAIRTFSERASLACVGVLVASAFLWKSNTRFRLYPGPLVCLLVACAIVYVRPTNQIAVVIFAMSALLTFRLVQTTDARRIVASLVDGCGLYLLANVVGLAVGLRSPAADIRIGGLAESTGFVRTIYPITTALNAPPAIAAIFVVAFAFLVLEPGAVRRILRSVCFIAALIVLAGAGSRTPIAVAAILTVTILCFPLITRWIAQVTTVFAAVSFFLLTFIAVNLSFIIAPLISLAPGRENSMESIASLQNRDIIWRRSIEYWFQWVNDPTHVLFGYGMNGQYRSGVSISYKDMIASIVKNPELASVHNSFLQQVFDGGLVGWFFLMAAIFWASTRIARQRSWGIWGMAAIGALTTLLLAGLTEVAFAPGPYQDTFWLLIILVGVACQTTGKMAAAGAEPKNVPIAARSKSDSATPYAPANLP